MESIPRVRIAPSPTGFAHVGTAYTALLNYAFAQKNKGKFVIRIEDTDVKRNIKGAEKAIFKGLSWLGLSWDEGVDVGGKYAPYRSSDRLDLYESKIEELLNKDLAYKEEGAVRFKNPGKDVYWKDLIRGEVSFPGDQITDFVIQKSDGYPTYNFAVVVDDIAMKITHIIRGEEHISNTPRQLVLYDAFGESYPHFAHHPTLRNKDKKKLSKRRDTVDIEIFRKEGYLPQAMLNFLALLGWSHPKEKEIFSLSEFVELFSLERVRSAGPVFDTNKLDWMNGEYIKNMNDPELRAVLYEFYDRKFDEGVIGNATPLIKERIHKLSEFKNIAGFFFEWTRPNKNILGKDHKIHLSSAIDVFEDISSWDIDTINKCLMKVVKDNDYKTGKFFMDLRIAVTGKKVTPPINESIVILGKEETLKRINKVLG